MFGKFRKSVTSIYDEPIQKVLNEMEQYDPSTQEYSAAIRHLETLSKLHAEEKSGRNRISADTMAIVAGNILGILAIVAYEQKHVMTSKATGFILKTK